MKVVHVIRSMDPSTGGPATVVTGLALAQMRSGDQIVLLTDPSASEVQREKEHLSKLDGISQIDTVSASERRWNDALSQCDLVHVHGVWCSVVKRAAAFALKKQIPVVQATHGALGKWSMSQKALKKRLAFELIYRRAIEQVTFLHANNALEERDLRSLGIRAPIEIVPHGINMEEVEKGASPALFRERFLGGADARFILFVGRLAVYKSPDLLVRAFAKVTTPDDLHLVLAGPDDGYRGQTLDAISRQVPSVRERIHLVGPIYGENKDSAYRAATLTCVPSRFESFGMVLIEALGRGCPVVYSDMCSFPQIAAAGAGLEVPLDEGRLASALQKALTNEQWLTDAAQAGKRLVKEQYDWNTVAATLSEAYRRYGVG